MKTDVEFQDPQYRVQEWKVIALRESMISDRLCDTPEKAASYWRDIVASHPYFNPEVECLVALILNARRWIKGHVFISTGTLDTILVHPREVFRAAIVAAGAAIIVMHNHPSGDPTPSDGDIKVTRDLIRAGQILKIELLDHVIMGSTLPGRLKDHCSLREMGYFYVS